jgi:adenylate cyclase
MQDDIITRLARTLQIELTIVEASRVGRARPENPDAEELALQCEAVYLRSGSLRKEMLPAYGLCERALEIDGRNVHALVILALRSLVRPAVLLSTDPQADLRRADELVSRALVVDSNNYLARYARSYFLALQRPEDAIVEAERAFALNPSFLQTNIAFWIANWAAGRPEKANEYVASALRLLPQDPLAYAFLRWQGLGLFSLSRYEDATNSFKRSIALNPDVGVTYMMLTSSLAISGNDAEAKQVLRRYMMSPDVAKTIAEIKMRQPIDIPFVRECYERVYQGLRKAGMPEN